MSSSAVGSRGGSSGGTRETFDDSANWSAVHSSRPSSSASAAAHHPQHQQQQDYGAASAHRPSSPPIASSRRPPSGPKSHSAATNHRLAGSPQHPSLGLSNASMADRDHNANAFGQLVVQNAKAQQTIATLRKELEVLRSSKHVADGKVADLEGDVTHLTRQLAHREKDFEELRYENGVLRDRLEKHRTQDEYQRSETDQKVTELRRKLDERSALASHFFFVATGLMRMTDTVDECIAQKEAALMGYIAESSRASVEEVVSAFDAAQTNALAEALREHERALQAQEAKLNAILAREQAQHTLSLQSYESQISDLERKLRSQSAMITQQRRHEAVLRGVVAPEVVEFDEPSQSSAPAAGRNTEGPTRIASLAQTTTASGMHTRESTSQPVDEKMEMDDEVGPIPLRQPPPFRASASRSPSPPALLAIPHQQQQLLRQQQQYDGVDNTNDGSHRERRVSPPLAPRLSAPPTNGNQYHQQPYSGGGSTTTAGAASTTHIAGNGIRQPQPLSKLDQVDLGLASCLRQLSRNARR